MAKHSTVLDDVFFALSDVTRRRVVERLSQGPASVGDLAADAAMTMPSFLKHVRTLEGASLIRTSKTGRVRMCLLNETAFAAASGWLEEQRSVWEAQTDRLERFVTTECKE